MITHLMVVPPSPDVSQTSSSSQILTSRTHVHTMLSRYRNAVPKHGRIDRATLSFGTLGINRAIVLLLKNNAERLARLSASILWRNAS